MPKPTFSFQSLGNGRYRVFGTGIGFIDATAQYDHRSQSWRTAAYDATYADPASAQRLAEWLRVTFDTGVFI